MRRLSSKRLAAILVSAILVGCGGGGDGGVTVLPPAALFISPTAVNFGAVGSTKQVTTTYKDANGTVVTGTAVTFALSGTGASATVSTAGLVTAVAPGAGVDTVVATGNGLTAKAPIFVTQVPASITVTSTSLTPDTLFAATRTRQFSAAVKDTNNNAIASPGSIGWTSTVTTAATVGASTGLVTAVGDGTSSIQASAGAAVGSRSIVIRRLPAAHSLSPTTGTISTLAGTAGPFTATVTDSATVAIPVTWTSRSTGIFTVTGATGTSASVTAVGNGTANLVTSVPALTGAIDSASITVSGQPLIPTTAAVTVGDNFFKSGHNSTQNPAIDTIAAGGTVTWTFSGAVAHGIGSTGTPSFTSQTTAQITGTHSQTFATAGSYTYDCIIHGSLMTGTIVVR